MRYFYKYIAIFVFVIFTFPITFRTLHVLLHHSHRSHHKHSSECKHHHQVKNIRNNPDNHEEAISNYKKSCPICDYHFPIKDFSKKAGFINSKPITIEFVCELEIKIPYKQICSIKTPRAPPAKIS